MKNSFSFHLATMFLLVLAIMPLSATAEPMASVITVIVLYPETV